MTLKIISISGFIKGFIKAKCSPPTLQLKRWERKLLRLAVIHGIVQDHHGDVFVEGGQRVISMRGYFHVGSQEEEIPWAFSSWISAGYRSDTASS